MISPVPGEEKWLDKVFLFTVISLPVKGSSYQPEKRLTSGPSIRLSSPGRGR
ncbi:MAG: hypothetical protein H6Q57_119 [Geobacteraceae bacterium]|jgi:hypothetical protein|nr:hypothetical protein [Geobacteraceae bacterium]